MSITDRIIEQLVTDCEVTFKLLCEDPTEPYFKGLHEQSLHALRNVATIIKFHRED